MKLPLLVEAKDISFDCIIVSLRDIHIPAERIQLNAERRLDSRSVCDKVIPYDGSCIQVKYFDGGIFSLIVVSI